MTRRVVVTAILSLSYLCADCSVVVELFWRKQTTFMMRVSAKQLAALKACAGRHAAAAPESGPCHSKFVSSNDAVLGFLWALTRAARGRTGPSKLGTQDQFMLQTLGALARPQQSLARVACFCSPCCCCRCVGRTAEQSGAALRIRGGVLLVVA